MNAISFYQILFYESWISVFFSKKVVKAEIQYVQAHYLTLMSNSSYLYINGNLNI